MAKLRSKTWTCAGALTLGLIVAMPPSPAHAGGWEISEDERLRVPVPQPVSETPRLIRGAGTLPYGTAPDWDNTGTRRQVGGLDIADLDGNGYPELVVGCYNSNSFPPYDDWHNFIYYNSNGTLEATPSWISADQVSTTDVRLARIDADPFLDLVATNGAGSASVIYFGTATGPSTTSGWTQSPNTFTIFGLPVDVDHDGDTDLITANQGFNQFDPFRPLYLYENVAGVLSTTPSWQSDEMSIQNFLAWADYDGDGWEDLAVSKWINFESGIYRNIMGSLETTPTWTTGETGDDRGVAFADLDGNGDPDLALGHDPTQVFTNVGGVLTNAWTASGTFFGQQDLVWADVDGDSDPDLAEVHFANGVVNLYLNDGGSLGTVPAWSYDSGGVGTALAFGDINGNGMPDLVLGNAGDPSVMIFYNQLAAPVFTDGFESGDTTAWTTTSSP